MSETEDDIPAVLDAPAPLSPGANDFVPFAASPAAEVMPLAQYVDPSFTTRLIGFQTGVAQNVELNRVWRQASIIASMIGQFIATETGQHAVDDGTDTGLATLLAQFQASIQTILGGGNLTQAEADLLYLKLTGGTLTGPLAISGSAGTPRSITSRTGAATRWVNSVADNSTEGGANSGSNWTLFRYDDSGNPLDTVMICHRDTGVVEFPHGIIGGTGAGQIQPPLGGWANGQLIPYGSGQFQLFMASATFTVPPLVNSIRCRVVGAGGNCSGQSGGGGGEYAHGVFNVTPATQYAVTVGTGTTSVGSLISAFPGGVSGSGGAGGSGGVGGTIRFRGGSGGAGTLAGGGAAGSVLGIGGNGGSGGSNSGCSGGAVGGKNGSAGAQQGLGAAVGGASPFSPGVWTSLLTAANGAPDATGGVALGVVGSNAVGHSGTRAAGPTQPRYWGETLTGGGGSGAVDTTGSTTTSGGNGGDGSGGGSSSNTTTSGNGGNGGIFGGGAGGSTAFGGQGGGNGGPGGGGGGGGNASTGGLGGSGWCVIEW